VPGDEPKPPDAPGEELPNGEEEGLEPDDEPKPPPEAPGDELPKGDEELDPGDEPNPPDAPGAELPNGDEESFLSSLLLFGPHFGGPLLEEAEGGPVDHGVEARARPRAATDGRWTKPFAAARPSARRRMLNPVLNRTIFKKKRGQQANWRTVNVKNANQSER